jgi:hypothetical protein
MAASIVALSAAPSSRLRGSLVGATWDTGLDRSTLICPADRFLAPIPGAAACQDSLREEIALAEARTMCTVCRNRNRQLLASVAGRVRSWLGASPNSAETALSA